MTITAETRNRLKSIRERTSAARQRMSAAREAVNLAASASDPDARRAAEVALEMARGEVELATELESTLLSQMAGVSGATFGQDNFLDDPDTIRMLEQYAHSSLPIGAVNLGPLMSAGEFVQRIESGAWGSVRAESDSYGGYPNPNNPDIPDTARLGPYRGSSRNCAAGCVCST